MKIKKLPTLEENHAVEYFISDNFYFRQLSISRSQFLSLSAAYNLRIISFRQDWREILLINSPMPLVELCLGEI
jgi:hypothetical protein